MADPQHLGNPKVAAWAKEHGQVRGELDEQELRWMTLAEQLEALS